MCVGAKHRFAERKRERAEKVGRAGCCAQFGVRSPAPEHKAESNCTPGARSRCLDGQTPVPKGAGSLAGLSSGRAGRGGAGAGAISQVVIEKVV